MADNPTLPYTGDIAGDDIAGVLYQRVKLVDGTLDATTAIAAGGGVEAGALRVTLASDSTGVVSVDDNGAALTVDNGGTFAVQATLAAETTKVIGTVNISATQTVQAAGDIAHDGTDSGNPIKEGRLAVAHNATVTAVSAAGDRVNLVANRNGLPYVMGGCPNIVTVALNITTAVTDVAINSMSLSAGTVCVVTAFQFTVDNASTVFPKILLGFGGTNTPTTTGVIGAHGGVPAGGGFGRGDGSGIIGIGGDGEELRVTTVGTIGGNGGYLCVSYYLASL